MTVDPLDQAVFARVLGDELRRRRKERGWTRKDLLEALGLDISLQTLATWELGTRQVSVVHLAQVCRALDVTPMDILARTYARVMQDPTFTTGWTVNLKAAVTLGGDLTNFARWAAVRLKAIPRDHRKIAHMDQAGIEALAVLCGLEPSTLARWLLQQKVTMPATSKKESRS